MVTVIAARAELDHVKQRSENTTAYKTGFESRRSNQVRVASVESKSLARTPTCCPTERPRSRKRVPVKIGRPSCPGLLVVAALHLVPDVEVILVAAGLERVRETRAPVATRQVEMTPGCPLGGGWSR
jgi:hypothetical protein